MTNPLVKTIHLNRRDRRRVDRIGKKAAGIKETTQIEKYQPGMVVVREKPKPNKLCKNCLIRPRQNGSSRCSGCAVKK